MKPIKITQYSTTLSCPKPRSASDRGVKIKAPKTGPTNVPIPPITVAAIGKIEKSIAKRDNPNHPYRWLRYAPPKHPISDAMNTAPVL